MLLQQNSRYSTNFLKPVPNNDTLHVSESESTLSTDTTSDDDSRDIFIEADPSIQSVLLSESNCVYSREEPEPKTKSTPHFIRTNMLCSLLNRVVRVTDNKNASFFEISVRNLLEEFSRAFARAGVELVSDGGICLVGSSASALIKNIDCFIDNINDCDVLFRLKYPENFFEILKMQESVVALLLRKKLGRKYSLHECGKRFFKETCHVVTDNDAWSLIALGSDDFAVDIKVMFKSSRQYAFSVDSFEIVLDHVLSKNNIKLVEVRSCFGDYLEAEKHLLSGLIVTRNPGEIRHGIFRYCLEIARGYHPENRMYDLIFTAHFYHEFSRLDIEYFSMYLSKFLQKHKKHWFCILTAMHYLLSDYSHPRSVEFLKEIVIKFFAPPFKKTM